MSKIVCFTHEFVDAIPEKVEPGKLYVSTEFGTVVHSCACGCGMEVVTPLTPTDWKLIFDGETVSLSPSIGNWSFPCRSHYWIGRGEVQWAGEWTDEEIAAGRAKDRISKERRYDREIRGGHVATGSKKTGLPKRLLGWFFGRWVLKK